MTIGTRLFTLFRGRYVGTDEAGNRYYQERAQPRGRRRRRWVMYKGAVEASRVPPEWHGWLHYTVDESPLDRPPAVKPWQKPHQPNLTGTTEAYRPPGHDYESGQRAPGTGDYEPWRPS